MADMKTFFGVCVDEIKYRYKWGLWKIWVDGLLECAFIKHTLCRKYKYTNLQNDKILLRLGLS